MGWNGTGTFNLTYNWENDAANAIPITASRMDTQETDMAGNGFGNCLTRDGQGVATANLPMGGYKHTGAAVATTTGDYVTYQQYQRIRFAVYNSTTQNNVTGDGTDYQVTFDTADFNVGSGFSLVSSKFTAPVAGQLLVNGRVQVGSLTNSFTEAYCAIETSGGRIYISNDQNTVNLSASNQLSFSISDMIPLALSETAQLNIRIQGGSKGNSVIGGNGFTRFSGVFYPTV
jgi:hypothetical protein